MIHVQLLTHRSASIAISHASAARLRARAERAPDAPKKVFSAPGICKLRKYYNFVCFFCVLTHLSRSWRPAEEILPNPHPSSLPCNVTSSYVESDEEQNPASFGVEKRSGCGRCVVQ